MSKYVLTEADIEKISIDTNDHLSDAYKYAFPRLGKKSVKGQLVYTTDFVAKGMTVEMIQYTPEEIAKVPLKTIFKGLLIKVKNKFKRR